MLFFLPETKEENFLQIVATEANVKDMLIS